MGCGGHDVGGVAGAQLPISAKRADGATTPMMIYGSATVGANCSPLVVISHGAGGSERGYRYLADGLAKKGWFVIVPGHRESGPDVVLADMKRDGGRRGGLQELVGTKSAYVARLQDVGAALDWAKAHCTAKVQPFRALVGHSMGAETVMFEAGAKNLVMGDEVPKDRFDAYVAMSANGVGPLFEENAWMGITKPMFILTGTMDGALYGEPASRQRPYAGLPGGSGCDWLGVIDGATHHSFAGRGPNQERVSPEIVWAVDAFLRGAMMRQCVLPEKVAGFRLEAK